MTHRFKGMRGLRRPLDPSLDYSKVFEIRDADEGGFFARALGHAIFTEYSGGSCSAL
jgi:hypothetical protein